MKEAHKFYQTNFSASASDDTTPTNLNTSADCFIVEDFDDTTPTNLNTSADCFIVEDFFDFSKEDTPITDTIFDSLPANSPAASSHHDTTPTHHNSNFLGDGHFSSDLSLPYDDAAELEWLSKFQDESFSNEYEQDMPLTSSFVKDVNEESVSHEDMKNLQLISGKKGVTNKSFSGEDVPKMELISCVKRVNEELFSSEDVQNLNLNEVKDESFSNKYVEMVSSVNEAALEICGETNLVTNPHVAVPAVPAKARSKRPRVTSGKWCSRLLVVSPTTTTSSSQSETIVAPPKKHVPRRRDSSDGCDGRKCLHCATDKTPQWRTGPMGPKTLCNACGVRYKSGRLVPEYRPAASPTFMLTKHSNSHRKVLELRRQKEISRTHNQQQGLQLQHRQMMFDNIPSNSDDYLIHQHMGTDFTHLL